MPVAVLRLLRPFAIAALAAVAVPAFATAQRTFVASYGNDANSCTVTSPCRSFAAAITQTLGGGEVIVLDSAGYGPVTVVQDVAIIAPPGIYAGITVPAVGVGVATLGPTMGIVLRGLTINTVSGSGYGVRMTVGGSLTLEDCEITNFIGGYGVKIESPAIVKIDRTTVRSSAQGIVAGYGASVHITNSHIARSTNFGVSLNGGPVGTPTRIYVSDTQIIGVGGYTVCVDNSPSGSGTTGLITLTRVSVSECQFALSNTPSSGAVGKMSIANSIVANNQTAFSNNFVGVFESWKSNQLTANIADTGGGGTITYLNPI